VRKTVYIVILILFVAGCSPRLSPLYRDYEVDVEQTAAVGNDVYERIERGLIDAGWTLTEGITDNVVATETRTFRQWGLYSVEVELEVAPVGGDYVRLLVHPFRVYFTGARSKIPYLRGSLSRSVLKDLHASFEEEGLIHIGTAQSRDKAATHVD